MDGPFLAVDWGTTNRRVYVIGADDKVEQTERDDRGVLAVEHGDFAAEAAAIRQRFGDLPMLCAGMVGSNRGWREVPYVPAPVDLASLAAHSVWLEPGRTAIVPGASRLKDGRADVMRGEEVQLLGAALARQVDEDALLCQPGTHCKWAWLEGGRLVDFTTALTGETFALLRKHSLLADQMQGEVSDGPAFRAGVEEAKRGDLLASLFGARASRLLGVRSIDDGAAYVSGLLIGADVAARVAEGMRHDSVDVLADPELGALYGAAIEAHGYGIRRVDSCDAFVAGVIEIWRIMS